MNHHLTTTLPSNFTEVVDSLPHDNDEDIDPNAGRFVRYQFTPQFLRLKIVGAT